MCMCGVELLIGSNRSVFVVLSRNLTNNNTKHHKTTTHLRWTRGRRKNIALRVPTRRPVSCTVSGVALGLLAEHDDDRKRKANNNNKTHTTPILYFKKKQGRDAKRRAKAHHPTKPNTDWMTGWLTEERRGNGTEPRSGERTNDFTHTSRPDTHANNTELLNYSASTLWSLCYSCSALLCCWSDGGRSVGAVCRRRRRRHWQHQNRKTHGAHTYRFTHKRCDTYKHIRWLRPRTDRSMVCALPLLRESVDDVPRVCVFVLSIVAQ